MSKNSQCSVESIEGSCSQKRGDGLLCWYRAQEAVHLEAAMHALGSLKPLGQAIVSCAQLQQRRLRLPRDLKYQAVGPLPVLTWQSVHRRPLKCFCCSALNCAFSFRPKLGGSFTSGFCRHTRRCGRKTMASAFAIAKCLHQHSELVPQVSQCRCMPNLCQRSRPFSVLGRSLASPSGRVDCVVLSARSLASSHAQNCGLQQSACNYQMPV